MSDRSNINERLSARRTEEDIDAFDDHGCFAILRGIRDRGVMIDFRFQNGNREAFPFSLLEQVSYDPSQGITLKFMGMKVVLRGKNLATPQPNGVSLLEALHRHRVPWVREVEELRTTDANVAEVNQISIIPK